MSQGYAWAFMVGSGFSVFELQFQELHTIDLREEGEGNIVSYGAYAGDLNNDGLSDLSIPNEIPADVRVLLNNGEVRPQYDGSFVVHDIPSGSLPSPSEGGDFNEDGNIDIAVGNAGNNMLTIMLGDGAGGFSSITSIPTGGNFTRSVLITDADGDGHEDIITANRGTGNLSYFEGNGDGTFETPDIFDTTGNGETALAPGDANGDGLTDLFVGCLTSDEIAIMLSNGDGTFTQSDIMSNPGGAWMLASGDMNGDGHVDAVTAGAGANVVDVMLGDGTGQFSSITSYPSGNFTIAIDVGDLDNDGDLDMISSNYSSGDFYVFENDGSGGFDHVQTLFVEGAGSCAIIQDANRDSYPDVVGIDENEDRLYFYELSELFLPSIENEFPQHQRIEILQNPVRSQGTINVWLAAPQHVRLSVFDVLGRQVDVLVDTSIPSGNQEIVWPVAHLPSGTYFVRMETEHGVTTEELTVIN